MAKYQKNKIIAVMIVVSILLFTGCSKKGPENGSNFIETRSTKKIEKNIRNIVSNETMKNTELEKVVVGEIIEDENVEEIKLIGANLYLNFTGKQSVENVSKIIEEYNGNLIKKFNEDKKVKKLNILHIFWNDRYNASGVEYHYMNKEGKLILIEKAGE